MAAVPFELKDKKVFVAGHRGMVGSALVRRLAQEDVEILTVQRSEVDLLDQAATNRWFEKAGRKLCFMLRRRSVVFTPITHCAPSSFMRICS